MREPHLGCDRSQSHDGHCVARTGVGRRADPARGRTHGLRRLRPCHVPASDAGVVTGRYAIARFNLEATGRPSHAGARLAEGRSAIREMARKLIDIEDMTTEDCTFSVGVIHGGQWVNCVATTCTAEALSMAKRQEDLDR